MVILVPQIHLFNFPLFYILSFWHRIKTYEISRSFHKLRPGNIEYLNLGDYFDIDSGTLTRAEAVAVYEKIYRNKPDSSWRLHMRGRPIDLGCRAMQEIGKEIERFTYLNKIQSLDEKRETFIVESFITRFFLGADIVENVLSYHWLKYISFINVFLDRLNLYVMNLGLFLQTLIQIISGILCNKKKNRTFRYIHDVKQPVELLANKQYSSFAWIIDDDIINRKDVLIIFSIKNDEVEKEAEAAGISVVHISELSTLASPQKLFSSFAEILNIFIIILRSTIKDSDILLAKYASIILRWVPLVESISPKVYIHTFASAGAENPAIAYFRSVGIKTVACSYSASIGGRFFIESKATASSFRMMNWSNLMSDVNVVWNRNFKEHLFRHPQRDTHVEVIGPIMPADDSFAGLEKEEICRRFQIPYNKEVKFISIFDVPVFAGGSRTFPGMDFTPAEYKEAFMGDMYRLIKDLRPFNVKYLFKQKKKWIKGHFSHYTKQIEEIIDSLACDENVVILDVAINYWLPVILADLCITIPFGSPCMVALHYGKSIIFHDPCNIANYPRYGYDKLKDFITHDYDQLKNATLRYINDQKYFEKLCAQIDISDLVGCEPGKNSTRKLRMLLNELTGQ